MKRMILELDGGRCVSCGACAIACMDQNDIDSVAVDTPFRQVFTIEEEGERGLYCGYFSTACMHCANAPCVVGCPAGCLQKDPETGFTVYDNTNCIGCHSCAMACPFGVPSFGADGKMIKCDGCADRVKNGELPACVKACPFGALHLYTEEEYAAHRLSRRAAQGAKIAWGCR